MLSTVRARDLTRVRHDSIEAIEGENVVDELRGHVRRCVARVVRIEPVLIPNVPTGTNSELPVVTHVITSDVGAEFVRNLRRFLRPIVVLRKRDSPVRMCIE